MVLIRPKIACDCDVLVVGGGPAGSGLAYHLAKAGIKTIVLEAEKFPRDKVCGDGVSPVALRELHGMGITRTSKFKKANAIAKVGLFMENEKAFIQLEKPEELPYFARIIPRIELDDMIYRAAKKAGAGFLENCRLTDFKATPHKVEAYYKTGGEQKKITARLIVGADGSRSVVGRKIRGSLPDPEFQLLGMRAYYEGVNGPRDRVDIYFSEENFPGIYWLFPRQEGGANVGMAMIYKTCPESVSEVRQCFKRHISTNADLLNRIGSGRLTDKIQGWPITFYNSRSPLTANRAMLIGEAAGLINPLSGDGIQYALLSARWAAESLTAGYANGEFTDSALQAYEECIRRELAYDFSFSNLLVQFGRNKTLTPLWMRFMKILVGRCKDDPAFAATIAGIFEGTYPSYKALSPAFIGGILAQAGLDTNDYLMHRLVSPQDFLRDGTQLALQGKFVLNEIASNPAPHIGWLRNVVGNLVTVAQHTLAKNREE